MNKKISPAEKRERRIARQSRRIVVGMCLLLLALTIAALIISRHAPDTSLEDRLLKTHPVTSAIDHSPEELEKFWQNHMRKAVEVELMGYKCPIPEIRDRYALLATKVQEKYGTLAVELSSAAQPANKNNFAGNSFSNGVPRIILFIANCKDAYEGELANLSDEERQKTFDFVTIVGIIHEYEHIVGDPLRMNGAPFTVEDLVAGEKHAWAETCRYTLGPCIEKYGYSHFPLIRGYYTQWVNTGKDENSPAWEAFIRSVYKDAKTLPDTGNLPRPMPASPSPALLSTNADSGKG